MQGRKQTKKGAKRPSPARRPPSKYSARTLEIVRAAFLVCLCALIWCHVYNRFSIESWKIPVDYGVDANASDVKTVFADVKAASEGHIWPLIPKTVPAFGAPFVANWSDFPGGDEILSDAGGLLTHIIGLFAAVNVMTLLAPILAAVAFYFACRAMKCDWLWSFAGALLFAFSRFGFAHGVHHLTVTYYWHIPLCLLVCRWISTKDGLEFGTRRFAFALGVAVIAAVQNVYYTNMYIQLALLGGFFQLLRHGWKNALPAVCVAGAAAMAFLVMHTDTFVYHFMEGPNPAAVLRHYQWVEYYALKICDLFIPPPDHHFGLFADFAQEYFSQVLVMGEVPPGSYLGLAGIASLGWLVFVCARRMLKTPPRGLPLEAWQILWIIVYATVGGLNGLAASFGFLLFRSTTRYSIFILALVLLFAVRQLSALTRLFLARRPASPSLAQWRMLVGGVAACVTVFALWDQSPPQMTDEQIASTATVVSSDRTFTEDIEKRLPSGGMIFEIPVMDFPESPGQGISAYDHLRPYYYSKNLRYAFGSVKGRPRDAWQHDLARMTLGQAISTLESYGFSAIYVNRNGYPDRGEGLLKELKNAGRDEIIQSPMGDLFCVLLKPSPNPVLP